MIKMTLSRVSLEDFNEDKMFPTDLKKEDKM